MMQRIAKRRVNAERTAMKQTRDTPEATTWTRVTIADVAGDVELSIDAESIMKWLGRKALLNKRGVSRGLSGDVEVRVVRGTKKEVPRAEA